MVMVAVAVVMVEEVVVVAGVLDAVRAGLAMGEEPEAATAAVATAAVARAAVARVAVATAAVARAGVVTEGVARAVATEGVVTARLPSRT